MVHFIYIKRNLSFQEKQKEIYLNKNTLAGYTFGSAKIQLAHYKDSVLYTVALDTNSIAVKISASNSAKEYF